MSPVKVLPSLSFILLLGCGTVKMTPQNSPDAGEELAADASETQPDGNSVDGDAGLSDTIAPTVVSTSPPNNSEGIPADQVIVFEFSEAMDTASVEAAWNSDLLPQMDVSFSWNAEQDELTVTPNSELPLAEGTGLDPSGVTATSISVAIDGTASDQAGNPLGTTLKLMFATRKRMTASLNLIDQLTRAMRDDGLVFPISATSVAPGDDTGNRQLKVFMGFEVPTFPESADFEEVVLTVSQNSPTGVPFELGAVKLLHINTAVVDIASFSAALSDVGDFSVDEMLGPRSADVRAEFLADLANRTVRGDRTQFRLEFASATNSDNVRDQVRFSRASIAMAVTYVAK